MEFYFVSKALFLFYDIGAYRLTFKDNRSILVPTLTFLRYLEFVMVYICTYEINKKKWGSPLKLRSYSAAT